MGNYSYHSEDHRCFAKNPPIPYGFYILKKDLSCRRGTFSAGTLIHLAPYYDYEVYEVSACFYPDFRGFTSVDEIRFSNAKVAEDAFLPLDKEFTKEIKQRSKKVSDVHEKYDKKMTKMAYILFPVWIATVIASRVLFPDAKWLLYLFTLGMPVVIMVILGHYMSGEDKESNADRKALYTLFKLAEDNFDTEKGEFSKDMTEILNDFHTSQPSTEQSSEGPSEKETIFDANAGTWQTFANDLKLFVTRRD